MKRAWVVTLLLSLLVVCFSNTLTAASSSKRSKSSKRYSSKKRLKRRMKKKEKRAFSLATDITSSISADDKRNFSQNYSLNGSYERELNVFSLNISANKHFVKTVGLNERDFYLNAPFVQYSRKKIFKHGSWSINSLSTRVKGTSSELYKRTSLYGSVIFGLNHSFKLPYNFSFSHTVMGNKNLNKYENDSTGTYISYSIVNNFALGFSPTDKLSFGANYMLIDTKSYSGGRGSNRVSGIRGSYSFPDDWSATVGFESGADYMEYSYDASEIYNIDNSSMYLSIGKLFN